MKKRIAIVMAAIIALSSLPAGSLLAAEDSVILSDDTGTDNNTSLDDEVSSGDTDQTESDSTDLVESISTVDDADQAASVSIGDGFGMGGNTGMENGGDMGGSNSSSSSTSYSAVLIVTDTQTLSGAAYTSSSSDESIILVSDGGYLTLTGATLTKTSGDSSNTENSEFYGVNAGVLVLEGSTAYISGATISTSATGSNAVFATGTDAKINISDSTITTTGSSSARGLDATYGGYINASNVVIVTSGGSCAAVATDRGGGTVIATGSSLETNGSGSPVIYTTGDITVSDSTGTAPAAQLVVVEGKNTATVTDSTLYATGAGNRGTTDVCGVMIYQSQSGDAEEGTGTFTASGSTLTILSSSSYYTTAPMFFVTNTDAVINLTNTTLSYGSGILLDAEGTSEWGTSGSNGGNVTFNATSQILDGDIVLDALSSLVLNLTESSAYTGTINGANTASSVTLTLDATSSITLTGDSYVTSLTDADTTYSNINLNGYTLYVNGTALEITSDADSTSDGTLALGNDGNWYYYVNGEIDTTFTGIASYNSGLFFVVEGAVAQDANGLNLYNDVWYYLACGQVQTQYTGLVQYDDAWFFITEGILDTSKNGLVPYDDATFLIADGQLLTSYNGVWQNASSISGDDLWYFIAAGKVQAVSQVVMYDNEWFVVEDGVLASDYNGTIEYDGATFTVVAGQLYA